MKRFIVPVAALLGIVMGIWLTLFWGNAREKHDEHIVCRPSVPELLAGGPKVLFWGNSLAFDHSWRLPDLTPVNCARQGLTLEASVPLARHLPDTDFTAVVLFFGTVELLGGPIDVDKFRRALDAKVTMLRTSYPDVKVIIIGVPEGSALTWDYGDHHDLAALNAVLRNVPGTEFIDATSILSGMPENRQTYDGAHLEFRAYTMLEAELIKSLSDMTGK